MCLNDWVLRWLPMCVSKVVLTLQEDDSAKCVPWSIDFSRTPSIPAFQRQRQPGLQSEFRVSPGCTEKASQTQNKTKKRSRVKQAKELGF